MKFVNVTGSIALIRLLQMEFYFHLFVYGYCPLKPFFFLTDSYLLRQVSPIHSNLVPGFQEGSSSL